MNGKKSEREKILADTLADVLLIAEMYHGEYPFDEDHKEKQARIFHYAHELIGNNLGEKRGRET
jgi:NTP pyrophosphatase (non-canonical NTP hydrolase)